MLNKFKNLIGKNLTKTFRTARTGDSFTLRNTDFGKINVECDLIRRVVERAVKEIEGIYDVTAKIDSPTGRNALQIHFSLGMNQGYSAQSVSVKLVKEVREVLEEIFQIIDVEIYMRVTDISQSVQKKSGRRVR